MTEKLHFMYHGIDKESTSVNRILKATNKMTYKHSSLHQTTLSN